VVGVALIIGIFALIAHNTGADTSDQLAPDSVLKPVTQTAPAIFAAVGTGGLNNPFTHATGDVLKNADGKPVFTYAGGEFCPHCAAERWSLVMALSRFGTFSNLHLISSSEADIHTFTFVGSSYSSQYVDFSPVEVYDQSQGAYQTPTAQQQQVIDAYNKAPYTQGGIPFLSVANQYLASGAGYEYTVLQGLDWQQIADKLGNPNDAITKDVVGNANYITAAICQTTNQQPGKVCQSAPIPDIEQHLNSGK
jgi:hypothetical protein